MPGTVKYLLGDERLLNACLWGEVEDIADRFEVFERLEDNTARFPGDTLFLVGELSSLRMGDPKRFWYFFGLFDRLFFFEFVTGFLLGSTTVLKA